MGLSKETIAEILSVNHHYGASGWEYIFSNDSFVGTGGFGVSCKISCESAEDAAENYLDKAIKEINAESEDAMDGKRKQYIVDFLNTNHYFNHHNWRVGTLGFVAGKEGDPTFFLEFDKAEEVIQDYREMLAGQGCVPHEPASESESKPTESEIIKLLMEVSDESKIINFLEARSAAKHALDLIIELQHANAICERDHGGGTNSAILSADEALEILNREEHNELEWRIMAVSNHDSDVTLEYEELIGTAMYYREMRRG